jgi:hypothetical protein
MVDPQDIIQFNLDGDQAGQVVQQQVLASTQSMLAFKVEQSKVQEFFGQISHMMFIPRIDDIVWTNNWTNAVTYTNVVNTLRGFS